jgi:hypothetical protein
MAQNLFNSFSPRNSLAQIELTHSLPEKLPQFPEEVL